MESFDWLESTWPSLLWTESEKKQKSDWLLAAIEKISCGDDLVERPHFSFLAHFAGNELIDAD